jgi:hypothetical protein
MWQAFPVSNLFSAGPSICGTNSPVLSQRLVWNPDSSGGDISRLILMFKSLPRKVIGEGMY